MTSNTEFSHLHRIDGRKEMARVNCTKKSDFFKLRGYATDEHGKKKKPPVQVTLTETSKDRLSIVEARVVSLLAEKLAKAGSGSQNNMPLPAGKDPISVAFEDLKGMFNSLGTIHPAWDKRTTHRALTYFEKNILPFLVENAQDGLVPTDLKVLKTDVIVAVHLKNGGTQDTADVSVRRHIMDSSIIYAMMKNSHQNLPDIDFKVVHGIHIATEQPRYLDYETAKKFYAEVYELAKIEPLLAKRIVAAVDPGMRPSEAAGFDYTTIIVCLTPRGTLYGKSTILRQEDPDHPGQTTDYLKTDNSYRPVIFSTWAMKVLQLANKMQPEDPECPVPVSAAAVSAKIMELLFIKCGVNLETIYALTAGQNLDAEACRRNAYDGTISAYIWRRYCANKWKNICGFTLLDVDIFMGHGIDKKEWKVKLIKDRYKDPKVLDDLAELNENYIYDPKLSGNPAYKPTVMQVGDNMSLVAHTVQSFVNRTNEPILLDLLVETTEPGEELIIQYSSDSLVKLIDTPSKKYISDSKTAPIHTAIGELNIGRRRKK